MCYGYARRDTRFIENQTDDFRDICERMRVILIEWPVCRDQYKRSYYDWWNNGTSWRFNKRDDDRKQAWTIDPKRVNDTKGELERYSGSRKCLNSCRNSLWIIDALWKILKFPWRSNKIMTVLVKFQRNLKVNMKVASQRSPKYRIWDGQFYSLHCFQVHFQTGFDVIVTLVFRYNDNEIPKWSA